MMAAPQHKYFAQVIRKLTAVHHHINEQEKANYAFTNDELKT